MELKIFRNGILLSNSYALINEKREAVLIDAGSSYAYYKDWQEESGIIIKYVLFTHGHFDHIAAGKSLQDAGAKCAISELDESFTYSKLNLASTAGFGQTPFKCDFTFKDGEVLNLCGFDIKVIATPGHTAGSVCFYIDNMLFSGDTLFDGEIGRTDFPTGSYKDIIQSIKNKLLVLSEQVVVHPGHEGSTTIGKEKKYNHYVGTNADN